MVIRKCPVQSYDKSDINLRIELKNMKSLMHPNISIFIGICFGADTVYIIMEHEGKGSIKDIIERVDYRTVVKQEAEPISIIRYESNPKFHYFIGCNKDSDLALPLLAKVVNR